MIKKHTDKRICRCERKVRPSFGLEGDKRPKWCLMCPDKPIDAMNIANRRCRCNRKVKPNYGLENDKRATWCSRCPNRPINAIDVVHRKCLCEKKAIPVFGHKGDTRPKWCSKCPDKDPHAINIKAKKCPCGKSVPHFGLIGDSKPTWCAKCPDKQADAIDIKNRRCACGRSTNPIFGFKGDVRGTWCAKCPDKHADAIDISSVKRCPCDRMSRPSSGLEGDTRATWCVHCPDKPTAAIDIKNQKCPCNRMARPSFGLEGDTRATWCVHCPDKPTAAIDIKNKTCISEWCDTRVCNIKFQGYCLRCFVHLFPDNKITRNYKTKEIIVREFVKHLLSSAEYAHLEHRYDKVINGGCSRRQPDFMIDCLTHVVAIEIDERGHDTEAYCSCENKRMCEIWNDIGNRPIVFLRFNPDSYIDSKGHKQQSCFGHDKQGFARVKPSHQKNWQTRLQLLEERLKHHMDTISDKGMDIEHLFYNGFHAIY